MHLLLSLQVWAGKDEHEALTGAKVGLTDYMALFLEKRFFAIPRLVTEVAYNLIYSLNAHNYDADCNLFLRIFTWVWCLRSMVFVCAVCMLISRGCGDPIIHRNHA